MSRAAGQFEHHDGEQDAGRSSQACAAASSSVCAEQLRLFKKAPPPSPESTK